MMVLPETHIKQLLSECPECMEFLWSFRRYIDQCTTVEALANHFYLPVDTFVSGLSRVEKRVSMNPCNYPNMKQRLLKKGAVNMAGFVTFTWQQAFEEELANFASQKKIKLNLNIFSRPEKGAFQNYLAQCESPEDLPEILLGKGFSSLMTRQFVDNYIRTGIYQLAVDVPYHPVIEATSLYDTEHHYHTFGVNEFLMVYDKTKECPAGMPSSWSDLFRPEYKGMITQMGKNLCDHFGFVLLFYLYHIYGENSIKQYVSNVKSKQHFSQIIKNMAAGHPDGAPINALHGFTTSFIRSDARPFVEIINPVDGNPTVSHFFLIKHDASDEAIEMARHLYSPQIGEIIEKGGTIHVAPTSKLAEGKRLKWIGWDAVKNAPLPYLKEYLGQVAAQVFIEIEMDK
jgi:ABC-type Fe3+ transport system substrate-binding protein